MSKFVVTTFDSETKAYEGTRALKELHSEGNITLYGLVVVTKDAGGKLSVKEGTDELTGTAVGSLVGVLVGTFRRAGWRCCWPDHRYAAWRY